MEKLFETTPEKLAFLLESINNREIALPDFQRDFVWDARATEELIESICQNYPAGSLLRIRNNKDFYFAPHEFAGAPILNDHQPSYLILDGQQRLTSLYQALYGRGEHCYLMNMKGLIEGAALKNWDDFESCVFFKNRREAKKHYATIEQQATQLIFPLRAIFGSKGGFEEWLDQIVELRSETHDEKKALKTKLREAFTKWIEPLKLYEFPMVTLSEKTSAAAICTIFETLNRTGVKLSVFDLLAARFWPKDVRLRDLWEKARGEFPQIEIFEIDPYYAIQAVALFAAQAAPSCKRKDVLELKVDQITTGWDPVVEGLAYVLEIFASDCGVLIPGWLPYNTILIPAAAALAFVRDSKGPTRAAIRKKLCRWFWCSVFGQAYENAPNSQAAKDFAELKSWFTGGSEPETVAKFSFKADSLREVTPRQRAVYRGVIALILRNGARDFHSAKPITASMIAEEKIEDHHVFPKGYLDDQKLDANNKLRDCVLNRTLIDKETNAKIGKKPPAIYLMEMEQQISVSDLLASHLLPPEKESPLRTNDFDEFLKVRQNLLSKKIEEATTGL